MKRTGWLYLFIILAEIMWSGVSWGRGYGHSHGIHRYPHSHFSGRQNFSFGVGYRTGLPRSYGHFDRRGHHARSYGDFFYGQPSRYYRQSYGYGYLESRSYWPTYPLVAYPPVVVVPTDPPVYIQQPQPVRPMQSTEPAITTADYWYYCENPAGYYPEVKNCSGSWIPVLPRFSQ